MSKSESLIPDDVRALYEELIAEGGRVVPSDDPFWNDPCVEQLLGFSLASKDSHDPPMLLPATPEGALARLLVIWRDAMDNRRTHYEKAQAAAITLLVREIRAIQQQKSRGPCTIVPQRELVSPLHTAVFRSGEKTVRVMDAGPFRSATNRRPGETRQYVSGYRSPAPDLFTRGGDCRVLTDLVSLQEHLDSLKLGYEDGEQIRVSTAMLPMKLLVADDHSAMVPLGPYGTPCLLIRDQRLVTLFAAFFDLLWQHAEPWTPAGVPAAAEEDRTRQRILEALIAGLKDEAIARHLGISARTVRRHVAQIMRDLGATTRFAAGAAAVRQGLVPDTAAGRRRPAAQPLADRSR